MCIYIYMLVDRVLERGQHDLADRLANIYIYIHTYIHTHT